MLWRLAGEKSDFSTGVWWLMTCSTLVDKQPPALRRHDFDHVVRMEKKRREKERERYEGQKFTTVK